MPAPQPEPETEPAPVWTELTALDPEGGAVAFLVPPAARPAGPSRAVGETRGGGR
jgi:hypothetical protein